MAIIEEYIKILNDTRAEFPEFKIVAKKDSKLMKLIDVFLKVITFGQMNAFMQSFITTIGNTVYVPTNWEKYMVPTKAEIIRHERVHMRQAKKYGRFLFSFLYLMVFLPGGLSYFRKKFEMEAYEESLRAIYDYRGLNILLSNELKEDIISHFTTAQYFWMWPFRKSVEAWYDDAVKKIIAEKALPSS